MGTIIGRQYTPENSNGSRDLIHPETQVDAVLDPITGIPLRDQLGKITDQLKEVDLVKNEPGFISPEMVREFQSMASSTIVTSSVKPTFSEGGYWYNIYDPSMSTTDGE